MVINHALTNWKSCVKSRGMKCCELSTLERIVPVAATPGTGTPGTTTPGTATPVAATPGTTTPGTATLVAATPGTTTPGTTTPGIATLGTTTPGTGTNLLIILVVLIQRNRRSYCLISHQI